MSPTRPTARLLIGQALVLFLVIRGSTPLLGQDVSFERVQLSDKFYSEGGTYGDFNRDGKGDVAVGPWIYWGDDFGTRSRFYEGDAIDPIGYSENFLMYSGDANDDGNLDIYVLGFPGKESWWYENPGKEIAANNEPWARHTMLEVVDNESPVMADIDGDGLDDLVCSSQGHYGYATRAKQDPTDVWRFVKISPNNGYQRFTHGLGVGDVDNDGNKDLMEKDGWWKNPANEGASTTEGYWAFQPFAFSNGGSQMHAVDLDGDGKNEVVTGLAAHGFGLVYYRATNDAATDFDRVEIMTDDPANSPTGVAVSQLHAVEIGDINRDGVPDIITGKRWWAHANGDPGSSQPATLLWLETQRAAGRVKFVPHVVDNSSGVGTQITVGDVNGDGLLDLVAGIKRGAYLFLQRPASLPGGQPMVPGLARLDAFLQQPAKNIAKLDDDLGGFLPALDGRPLNMAFEASDLLDWEIRGPIAAFATADHMLDTGKQSPEAIGEAISRPFLLTHPWLSFEVGGNGHPEARVEVIDEQTGKPIASSFQSNDGALERQAFDVSAWKGHYVRVRVVDHAKDGFVTMDDLRLHASRP